MDFESFVTRKSPVLEPDGLVDAFRELALALSEIGQSVGVTIRAFNDSSLPAFTRLSPKDQQRAMMSLAEYVSICQDVQVSGGDLRSSRTFVWRALRTYGLVPNSDLFNQIDENDIVEIYSLDHVQIFRNFRFFEFCSHTLEDIYSRPWHELFTREDDTMTARLLEYIGRVIASGSRLMHVVPFGRQIVREQGSAMNFRLNMEVKSVAGLFSSEPDAQLRSFICVENAEFHQK